MLRNLTQHVCPNGLAAAVLFCGVTVPGQAKEKLMAAHLSVRARNSKAADVTVYVTGDHMPPKSVDYGARATVSWIFAKAGVRLDWRDGELGTYAASGSPVAIQLRFTGETSGQASPKALAYALPFGDGSTAITVMYGRIRIAGRSSREQAILAHVLAHEIGHVLQRTNGHAQTGVMRAHWSGRDLEATETRPLEFTSDDVDLMKQGLIAWKVRNALTSPEVHR